MRIIYYVLFGLFLVSCAGTKINNINRDDLQDRINFIDIKIPFQIEIIDYVPASTPCGVRASASSCIGISGIDTIRVLTLCNTDTTFRINQAVLVIPKPKPEFHVSIPKYFVIDSNGIVIPDLNIQNIKTIYGDLEKIK